MKDHRLNLIRKHGRDFLTEVKGYGPTDVEELRWLWNEYRRLRNDPDLDKQEDIISWQYIWIREWNWITRDDHKLRDTGKYFISKEQDQWKVIATGKTAEEFRYVCDYPTWASDLNLEWNIEKSQTDNEVRKLIADYYAEKARWSAIFNNG